MSPASVRARRSTVGGTRTLLEVHLLDFDRDIYGKYVHVNFLHKLRDEQRFESLDELKTHIQQDIRDARAFFRTYHPAVRAAPDRKQRQNWLILSTNRPDGSPFSITHMNAT